MVTEKQRKKNYSYSKFGSERNTRMFIDCNNEQMVSGEINVNAMSQEFKK
jgi:hypothetical protein